MALLICLLFARTSHKKTRVLSVSMILMADSVVNGALIILKASNGLTFGIDFLRYLGVLGSFNVLGQ